MRNKSRAMLRFFTLIALLAINFGFPAGTEVKADGLCSRKCTAPFRGAMAVCKSGTSWAWCAPSSAPGICWVRSCAGIEEGEEEEAEAEEFDEDMNN